jgi:hypothetical protein
MSPPRSIASTGDRLQHGATSISRDTSKPFPGRTKVKLMGKIVRGLASQHQAGFRQRQRIYARA